MDKIKKNFGFGLMRLPQVDEKIDYIELNKMVDTFLENGFNYFDTAHGYMGTMSEIAIRECLTKRHTRDKYILTNKLSNGFFKTEEEIRPLFESQLEACGVDYFDYYLMHAQGEEIYAKFKKCRAYETGLELLAEGKIKHFGISFHDKAELLDTILTEYPQVEVVQIQFNYVDYEDITVEGRKCYEVCRKHNKPIIVMEPVRGGSLASLPNEAEAILKAIGTGSVASYAIRYAASFEGIFMVLSGMSNMEQMNDNISFMKEFKPLSKAEFEAIDKVNDIFGGLGLIPCTACEYCISECPKNIPIPALLSCMNTKKQHQSWNTDYYYGIHTTNKGKASDCIKCGKCEHICPQHLKITELLVDVAKEFEKE